MTGWADKSETIDALSAAFVKALGQMTDVVKTQTANAGQFAYNYATLADAMQMARPILAEHQLAVTQTAEANHDEVLIWTTIVHSSGQYITYAPTRLPAGKTAQNTGSAVTYARRYALMAVLGLASEDDDGANASPRNDRPARPARKQPPKARTDEETEIRNMLASIPTNAAARIRGEFKATFGGALVDLEPQRHGEALDWMIAAISEWEHNNAETD